MKQTSSSNNNIEHGIATMMMMTNVRVSETERERETALSESEKSVHETFFGCSRSRIPHTVASALAQATTSCTLAAAAASAAARLYMWHISNFYIIPSMNRNLMNGTFLVCCTFAVFIHSWPICMCSDYTIFSFLIRFFCRSFVRLLARDTQIFHIYFICVHFHRHPIPSVFDGDFSSSAPAFQSRFLVNVVYLFPHLTHSRIRESERKKAEYYNTRARIEQTKGANSPPYIFSGIFMSIFTLLLLLLILHTDSFEMHRCRMQTDATT